MKPRTSFVLLASLLGALLFLAVALLLAFLAIRTDDGHPHSMIGVVWILIPAIYTPIGLILGLIFGFLETKNRMYKVLINLGISLAIFSLGLLTFIFLVV